MSASALDIYAAHKNEQLGANGVFTESATIDPTGTPVAIYGVYDENTYRGKEGLGHVQPKKDGPRFVVSTFDLALDVYQNKTIKFPYRSKTFIIFEVEKDEQGAQVLWLQ